MQKNRKISVCRIILEFPPEIIGGHVIHTIELARHMAPYLEYQFVITASCKEDCAKLDAEFPFEIYRVNYHQFKFLQSIKSRFLHWLPVAPLVNISFGLAAMKKCLWLNKNYRIDIIHAHGIGIALPAMILGRLINKPAVLMLDGSLVSYSYISGIYEAILLKYTRLKHYFLVDNGGPLIPRAQKFLSKTVPITPVPINIDTSRVGPKEKNLELAKRLGITEKVVFISIHNLEIVQGVEHAIYGFKTLLTKYELNNAVLLIVGEGSIRSKLETLTKELSIDNRVIFIGAIKNSLIPMYYALADAALATSSKVNMNTSTVEAMSCGKPVIAFSCGNTIDHLIKHMDRGLLVPVGDISALAEAMYLLYKSPTLRQEIGQNARKFILENRDWNIRIKTELNIYEKLTNSNK